MRGDFAGDGVNVSKPSYFRGSEGLV